MYELSFNFDIDENESVTSPPKLETFVVTSTPKSHPLVSLTSRSESVMKSRRIVIKRVKNSSRYQRPNGFNLQAYLKSKFQPLKFEL